MATRYRGLPTEDLNCPPDPKPSVASVYTVHTLAVYTVHALKWTQCSSSVAIHWIINTRDQRNMSVYAQCMLLGLGHRVGVWPVYTLGASVSCLCMPVCHRCIPAYTASVLTVYIKYTGFWSSYVYITRDTKPPPPRRFGKITDLEPPFLDFLIQKYTY